MTVLQIEAPLILIQLVFLSQQGQHFPILLSVFRDKGPVMKRLISLHTNILTHDEHRHRFLHRQQGKNKRNSGDSADGSQAQLESIQLPEKYIDLIYIFWYRTWVWSCRDGTRLCGVHPHCLTLSWNNLFWQASNFSFSHSRFFFDMERKPSVADICLTAERM